MEATCKPSSAKIQNVLQWLETQGIKTKKDLEGFLKYCFDEIKKVNPTKSGKGRPHCRFII